jgi:hypothetical protein
MVGRNGIVFSGYKSQRTTEQRRGGERKKNREENIKREEKKKPESREGKRKQRSKPRGEQEKNTNKKRRTTQKKTINTQHHHTPSITIGFLFSSARRNKARRTQGKGALPSCYDSSYHRIKVTSLQIKKYCFQYRTELLAFKQRIAASAECGKRYAFTTAVSSASSSPLWFNYSIYT